ncbi:MAG TPA: GDSL-type esterase/lipase family protein [Gemmataceae bacterium]|nr:GDSL-type esterase/lipase family protein [Gemmataceae bacterium]
MSQHQSAIDRTEILLWIVLAALLLVPAWTLTHPRRAGFLLGFPKSSRHVAQDAANVWDNLFATDLPTYDGAGRTEPGLRTRSNTAGFGTLRQDRGNRQATAAASRRSTEIGMSLTSQGDDLNIGFSAGLDDSISAWLAELDSDGDGRISLQEWKSAGQAPDLFQEIDRNRDGFLSAQEIRDFVIGRPKSSNTRRRAQDDTDHDIETSFTVEQGRAGRHGFLDVFAGPFGRSTSSPHAGNPASTSAARTSQSSAAAKARGARNPSPALPGHPLAAPSVPQYPDALATTPLPLNDGSNAYWMEREQQNEARLLSGNHPAVLFLGDSITDWFANGAGAPIWNNYLAPLSAADFAVSGTMTSQVLWQVETGQVALADPAVVVLMIGSNNLGVGQSPPAVTAGITKIVQEIQGQLPRSKILLLGILPRRQSPADPLRAGIAQVNASLARLADGKRIQYVDFGSAYLQADGSIASPLMPDYIHPSLLGYEIYAAAVWQPLLQMLGN